MRAFLMLILLLSMAAVAFCEWNDPITSEVHSDSLVGLEKDTVTFYLQEQTDVIYVQVILDSLGAVLTAATDSFAVWNRSCGRLGSLHRGGSMESLQIVKADGTQTALLNWTPGEIYAIVVDPFGGRYQQFVLRGSDGDTIGYQLICIQVNSQ